MFSINSVPCHTPAGFNSPNRINNTPPIDPCYLHPFGCLVWYKVPEVSPKKLDPKGRASILLSYIGHGLGYQLWDLQKKCVVKSRDVVFIEDVFPYVICLTPPSQSSLPVEIKSYPSRPEPKELTSPLSQSSPPAVGPPPSALPRIVCTTRSERRLENSTHAPANRRHAHLVPLPESDDDVNPASPVSKPASLPPSPVPEPTPPSLSVPSTSSR